MNQQVNCNCLTFRLQCFFLSALKRFEQIWSRVKVTSQQSTFLNTPFFPQDVGCGGGILSERLARLGADVTGIDPVQVFVLRHYILWLTQTFKIFF